MWSHLQGPDMSCAGPHTLSVQFWLQPLLQQPDLLGVTQQSCWASAALRFSHSLLRASLKLQWEMPVGTHRPSCMWAPTVGGFNTPQGNTWLIGYENPWINAPQFWDAPRKMPWDRTNSLAQPCADFPSFSGATSPVPTVTNSFQCAWTLLRLTS